MTIERTTGELELTSPTAPKVAPQRRKLAPKKPPVAAELPLESVGGIAGLWKALIGRPEGAQAKGDTGLTAVFMLCILFGTALCFVGAFDVPYARQIGFAGPLLATLAYPLWGAAMGAATRPSLRERLADNSYYLGFIFTQIALLVGFLPAAFGSAELSADQIIRFFGVALGASLIGLIARTVLIQMSYSIDESADIVSGEVSALARAVSKQSSTVLEEFDELVQRLRSSQEALTADLHKGMGALAETVASYQSTLRHDAIVLHQGVSAASAAAERVPNDLAEGQVRLSESLSEVARVIDQLKLGLQSEMRNATASIHATTEAVHRGMSSMQSVQGLDEGITLIDERVAGLGERLAGVDERLSSSSAAIDESLRTLDQEIERSTQRSVERAAAVTQEANEVVASLERTLAGFRSELERLRV